MRKRRNWLKTTIAMLTLIATVIETGFSSVSTFAAEITTEDGIVVNNDAVEDAVDNGENGDLDISVESAQDVEDVQEEAEPEQSENAAISDPAEEEEYSQAEELSEGTLDVSDSGISGHGYKEISVYVDTENLGYRRSFRIEFTGPAAASYNTIINDDLSKTNDGRYDFENLEGGDFTIRATSSDDVILSYKYNSDGYPTIVVENAPTEKKMEKTSVTFTDDSKVAAIAGEGYDSVKVSFNTDELSDRSSFKLIVETDAEAKVDGEDATKGIDGLTKDTKSLVIEGLNEEAFTAYVITDNDDLQIQTVAYAEDIENGEASFTVDDLSVKRVYEYEDSKISVTATLEKADAVPDDAEFIVTEVVPESTDYNYETYMGALNENAETITGEDPENVEFNDTNTLLYDIGFFIEEDGKKVEFEPENGSVKFEIRFKDQQLSEAENDEAISVVHLPLTDSVKDSVDTTADAKNIETNDVKVEVVDSNDTNASVDAGTVEFDLDSLSVIAIIDQDHKDKIGTLTGEPGEAFTNKELLGNSWTYGITAVNLNLVKGGDAETNFAAKNLFNKSCSQTGMTDKAAGSLHSYYLLENFVLNQDNANAQQLKLKDIMDVDFVIPSDDSDIVQNKRIISTDTEHNSNPHVTFVRKGRVNIQNLLNNMMVNATSQADTLAARNSITDKNVGVLADSSKVTLDITADPAGTYYIHADEVQNLAKSFAANGALEIKKKNDQKIVFIYTGTEDVTLNKYILNGTDSVAMANQSSRAGTHIEDIIFVIPNAGTVNLNDMAGIIIAPRSTVEVTGVGGGWLIGNTVNLNCEWHFTNGDLPKPGNVDCELPVEKYFEGGAGKWKGGFKFTLQEINEGNNWADVGDPMSIILNGNDSETAKGRFELSFDPTQISWWASLGADDARRDEGYTKYHTKWYRVTEDVLFENRDDVEFNIYEHNPAGEAPNSDYWFVHLFIYSDDDYQNMLAVPRTARKNPVGYDYGRWGLPCEEWRPIYFHNKPKVNEVDVTLKGIKQINDGTVTDVPDGKFEFQLYDYLGGNQFSTTAKVIDGVEQKKTNIGSEIKFDTFKLRFESGAVAWDKWEWKNRHIVPSNDATEAYFYYLIKETGCQSPYVADPTQFVAKVTLKKENGVVTPHVTYFAFKKGTDGTVHVDVTKAMNNDESFKFEGTDFLYNNTYSATGDITIDGIKYMEGRELSENEYTFVLNEVELDANGDPVKGTDGKDVEHEITRTNNIENILPNGDKKYKGNFAFEKIEYSYDVPGDIGKHIYRVREVQGADSNVNYDSTVKEVTVNVAVDHSSSKLSVTKLPADFKASFENKFTPPEGGITLAATKAVASPKVKGTFKFIFEELDENGNVLWTKEKTAAVGKTASIEEIKYTAAGTHKYRIREYIPTSTTDAFYIPGVVYDDRVYTVNVTVSDKGNKKLENDITAGFDKETAVTDLAVAEFNDPTNPVFVNDFETKNGSTEIEGEKELKGKTLEGGKFQFTIKPYDEDAFTKANHDAFTMNAPTTITNSDNGKFKFGKIEFTKTGDYKFLVEEDREYNVDNEVVYTTHYFVATVHVTDEDENHNALPELKCTKTYEEYVPTATDPTKFTAKNADLIKFINKKWTPGTAHFEATKLFNGTAPGNHVFKFKLTDSNDELVVIDGKDQIKPNDANGNIIFDTITYTLADLNGKDNETKVYYIQETDIPTEGQVDPEDNNFFISNGTRYDLRKHPVTVTLTKTDTDAGLGVSVNVEYDTADKVTPPEFENRYSAEGRYDLPGEKILRGREFNKDDSFSFKLYRESDLTTPIATEELTKGTGVFGIGYSSKGTFNFSADKYPQYLKFVKNATKDDCNTYYFRLYEVGSGEGITNDNRYFKIELTVTDDGNGNLICTDKIIPVVESENGTEVTLEPFHTIVDGVARDPGKVTFTNTYTKPGANFFQAMKIAKNEEEDEAIPLGDKTFDFELQDKDGARVGDLKQNDGTGRVAFDPISYTLDQVKDSPVLYSIHEAEQDDGVFAPDNNVFIAQMTLTRDDTDPDNVHVVATPSYFETVKVDTAAEADVTVDFGNNVIGYYKKSTSTGIPAVTFTNTYKAKGVVKFPVTKVLEGRDMSEDEFTAQLLDLDGNVLDTVTFPASKDGVAVTKDFKEIQYKISDLGGNETAHKYYKVVEKLPETGLVNGVKLGVEYTTVQYMIDVTLTDDHNGTIDTDWVAYENGTAYQGRDWWTKLTDALLFRNSDQIIKFVNKYNAYGKLELSAKKELLGRQFNTNEEFIFELKKPDGTVETKSTLTDGVKQADGTVKVVFDTITYNRKDNGVTKNYEYTITEKYKGEIKNGLHYSDDEYKINVTVTDDTKGNLGITGSINGNAAITSADMTIENNVYTYRPAEVKFTNIYVPDDLPITLGGIKALSGRDLEVGDVFGFKIKKADNSAKAFTEETVYSIAGGQPDSGKFTFSPIVFTPDDMATKRDTNNNIIEYAPMRVFKYEVCEVLPTDENGKLLPEKDGITFDQTVYTVTVVVYCSNGVLSAQVFRGDENGTLIPLYSEKDPVYRATPFTNVYKADGAITFPARKILVGGNKEDKFTFKLTSDEAGNDILRTVEVDGSGASQDFLADECKAANATEKYTFKYNFDDKGKEFTYYISEVVPKEGDENYKPFYKYSNTVYKVVVKVTDNGKGKLEATPTYTVVKADNLKGYTDNQPYAGNTFEFINEYQATGTTVINGKKQLNVKIDGEDKDILTVIKNRKLPEFTFRLFECDENGNIGKMLDEQKSSIDNGEFSFDLEKLGITYTLDDVGVPKRYKVVEVAPAGVDPNPVIGMKYDLTEYDVYVTIKDSGKFDGKLDVTKSCPQMEQLTGQKRTWLDAIKSFFGVEGIKPDVLVVNDYDSAGFIDPPVLTKSLMGRKLERGEFTFLVTGSYEGTAEDLLADGKLTKINSSQKGKNETVKNGYAPDGSTREYVVHPVTKKVLKDKELDPGELFVGDIVYRFEDLLKANKQDADGNFYDDFVYKAVEDTTGYVEGDNTEHVPVELYLFVHAVDNGKGDIITTGHGAGGALVWETVETKENGEKFLRPVEPDDFENMFINKFKAKGYIDLIGNKEMTGRELTKDDIFEFTITDVENYKKAVAANEDPSKYVFTVNNTTDPTDPNGAPKLIQFKHYDEKLNPSGVPFLNYEWGYGEDPMDESDDVNDTGIHTYRIEEKFFDENGVVSDTRYYLATVEVTLPRGADGFYDKKSPLSVDLKNVKRYSATDVMDPTFEYVQGADFEFTFTNPFEAHCDIEFAGHKKITNVGTGKDAEIGSLDGKFKFELIDYTGTKVKAGKVIASAVTDAKGDYVIKPVNGNKKYFFDQDDMYVNGKLVNERKFNYYLAEVMPSNGQWVDGVYESEGILYDNTYYMIEVTLHYDSNKKLVADVTSVSAHNEIGVMAPDLNSIKDLNYENRTKGYDFNNKVRDYIEKRGKKIWNDNAKDPGSRPTVKINLLRNGVKINSTQIIAPYFEYEFTTDQNNNKLPACDAKGKPYDYKVEEDPIDGYDSAVKVNDDGTIDFINTKGDIMIRKIDADTGESLAGATLAIYDGSTKLEEWVSEVGAHVLTSTLTGGKTYTLRELKAPEGYELASDVTFVAPVDGSQITVTMSDKPIIGSVRLTKADASTRERLAGAEFALYKENSERVYATGSAGSYTASKTTSNGNFAVDSNGYLTISNLPYGTYYFEETKAPEGYALATERTGFTILKSGELVEVTVLDPKALGAVRLRKVGSTGTGALAGATFELYSSTPKSVGQAAAATLFSDAYYRYGSYRTDSSGEIYVTDLPWGDYYFVEVDAPRGYEVNKDVNGDDLVYTFTVSAATADVTVDLGSIRNTPPETPPENPTPTPIAERIRRGGVVNGVLGVRAKPTSGVLGERIGPVTGDASNIILWLLLLTACVATIVATVVTGKKKKTVKQ